MQLHTAAPFGHGAEHGQPLSIDAQGRAAGDAQARGSNQGLDLHHHGARAAQHYGGGTTGSWFRIEEEGIALGGH